MKVTDLNTVTQTFSYSDNSTSNIPFYGFSGPVLTLLNGAYGVQLAFNNQGDTFFYRRKTLNNWFPWKTISLT